MIDYKPTASDLQVLGEHSEAIAKVQQRTVASMIRSLEPEEFKPPVLVKVCGDERLADIIRVFEAGDERRKETVWRLACALSKVKEA